MNLIILVRKLIKKYSRFLKYCVGGGTAFVVDFSLLFLLTEYAGIWYLRSATLSFLAAAAVNYSIQKWWTFKCKDSRLGRQFFKFTLLQIVGLGINNAIMYSLVEYAGFWYVLAKVIAAAVVLIWNFWASRKFVFNHNTDKMNIREKVIIAAEIFPPEIGGPSIYSMRLAKDLLKKGYDVRVICYSVLKPDEEEPELKGRVIRISGTGSLPLKYSAYFIRLLFVSFGAKVIYAQGPVASGLPACLVKFILRVKCVIKVVGDYAWEQTMIYKATKKTIDQWQLAPDYRSKSGFTNFKLRLLRLIERFATRNAAAVIVPSLYLKKILTRWGVSPDKIKLVYNAYYGSKPEIISRQDACDKIGIKGDIILNIIRFVPWKGMDFLVDIFPEIKKINPNFKLVMVGSGPFQKKIDNKVKDRGLDQDIILTGRVDRVRVNDYYLAASMFVLNSSYEGLSHVILDAMYYNLPIVACNIGGNPELIEDAYNGVLVGYSDKQAWLSAIDKIWNNANFRQKICSNPVVKMDVFSFQYMIAETIKILGI